MVVAKYVFQFDFWGSFNEAPLTSDCDNDFNTKCRSFAYVMGITRPASSVHYMSYLVSDILLLISLFIHKTAAIYLGIWE